MLASFRRNSTNTSSSNSFVSSCSSDETGDQRGKNSKLRQSYSSESSSILFPFSPGLTDGYLPERSIGGGNTGKEKTPGKITNIQPKIHLKGFKMSSQSDKKGPRPKASLKAVNCASNRLQSLILGCEENLRKVKKYSDSLPSIETQKITIFLEKYLDKLRLQKESLSNLGHSYSHHLQIREGVRRVAFAYTNQRTSSSSLQHTLHSIKESFVDANANLREIENAIEKTIGVYHIQFQGIKGYSRICAGDVYTLSVLWGNEKWKTKIHIGKDVQEQKCEFPSATFHSKLQNMRIKACEVTNLFSKQVVLVNKSFNINEELEEHIMKLTLDMNSCGSLKISFKILWCPLHFEICSLNDLDFVSELLKKIKNLSPECNKSETEESQLSIAQCNISQASVSDKSSEYDISNLKEKIFVLSNLVNELSKSNRGGDLKDLKESTERLVDLVRSRRELVNQNSEEEESFFEEAELNECFEFLEDSDDGEFILTGSTNLDICLEAHLDICIEFLKAIVSKRYVVEGKTVERLNEEGRIFGKIMDNDSIIYDELHILPEEFQHTWRKITSQYCSSVDSIIAIIARELKSETLALKLVQNISESMNIENMAIMTIFQYSKFFKEFTSWRSVKEYVNYRLIK